MKKSEKEEFFRLFGSKVEYFCDTIMYMKTFVYDPSLVSMSNVCDAGITQIVVGPNGGLRPCVE